MSPMTPAELQAAIEKLGLDNEGLADAIGVHKRTVKKWLDGDRIIQSPTAILIRIMVARPNWKALLTIGHEKPINFALGLSPAD